MPGESLSKYGGVRPKVRHKPSTQPAAPARPASSFKPATLIESPLQWDGSGLLPGESLSRHRNRPAEPVEQEEPRPRRNFIRGAGRPAGRAHSLEEQEFIEETIEAEQEEPEAEEELESDPEILEKELVSQWTKASLAEDDLASKNSRRR